MLKITPTTKFKNDLNKFKHRKNIIKALNDVIGMLAQEKSLEKKFCDHPLKGNWKESRECHVTPDLLLIYRVDKNQRELFLERFGSHSNLFG